MAKERGRNLGDAEITEIVQILDGWSGKLTWEGLIDMVEMRLYSRYTRQALNKHERVRQAFEVTKKRLSDGSGEIRVVASPELRAALERIARLEAENERLEVENKRLLEQFVVWAYNAHTRGLDKDFLSRPLPSVNRGQTVSPKLTTKQRRKH